MMGYPRLSIRTDGHLMMDGEPIGLEKNVYSSQLVHQSEVTGTGNHAESKSKFSIFLDFSFFSDLALSAISDGRLPI